VTLVSRRHGLPVIPIAPLHLLAYEGIWAGNSSVFALPFHSRLSLMSQRRDGSPDQAPSHPVDCPRVRDAFSSPYSSGPPFIQGRADPGAWLSEFCPSYTAGV
jgi:hypothetical protein